MVKRRYQEMLCLLYSFFFWLKKTAENKVEVKQTVEIFEVGERKCSAVLICSKWSVMILVLKDDLEVVRERI